MSQDENERLVAVAPYSAYRHESGINLLINTTVSKKANKCFSQNISNYSFKESFKKYLVL